MRPRPDGGLNRACDSSVLPTITVQVRQHYRKWGARAAGAKPRERRRFLNHRQVHFFTFLFSAGNFSCFSLVNPSLTQGLKLHVTLKKIQIQMEKPDEKIEREHLEKTCGNCRRM
jgi:hypothetical protein